MSTPLAYSIAEASEVSRISRTSIYEAINSRGLIARKNGRRTVILAEDLQRWLQSLPITNSEFALKPSSAGQCSGLARL